MNEITRRRLLKTGFGWRRARQGSPPRRGLRNITNSFRRITVGCMGWAKR